MPRILLSILLLFCLVSCAPPDYDRMQASVAERARQTLARYFMGQFGKGIDGVLAGLAAEGGFLDNPLVKILLPPPLGLMIDVGQAFHNDPKAALLDTLINKAAENVTLGAGPILQAAVQDIIASGKAEALFSGDPAAVTDYLREQSTESLRDALKAPVAKALEESGATALYTELAEVSAIVSDMEREMGEIQGAIDGEPTELSDILAMPDMPATVAPEDLDDYVTEKTIDGIFRMIEQKEKGLRQQIKAPVEPGH